MEIAPHSLKKYWCHICKKDFSSSPNSPNIDCPFCKGSFCEELETNMDISNTNHPFHFKPFDYNEEAGSRPRNINHVNGFFSRNFRPRTTSNLLDLIIEYLTAQHYEDNLEHIINQIMMNDPNTYGNPPASEKAVNELNKFEVSQQILDAFGIENTCAVCKEEFVIGNKCMSMPCNHSFHDECLMPWLKERNSCPICRFELPTDDEDFEKKKRNVQSGNGNAERNSRSLGTHTDQ